MLSSGSESAARGADNVVRSFLAVREGERVLLLSWRSPEATALLLAALTRAGANVRQLDLETVLEASPREALERAWAGITRSILTAIHGLPPALSMAVLAQSRQPDRLHLHLTRIDVRLFEQSFRADPERIAALNQRVVAALGGAPTLVVTSAAGTRLRVALSEHYPLLTGDGRPAPGSAENLPSGHVMVHPRRIEGTVVVDRFAVGALRLGRDVLRTRPLRVVLANGAVTSATASDDAVQGEIDRYLASHPNAGRVGYVMLPTHYLVRAESGIEVQDALLPGLGVGLGFSNEARTRAPFSCPVQLRLAGRGQTIAIEHGPTLVQDGRWGDEWMQGIDLFR